MENANRHLYVMKMRVIKTPLDRALYAGHASSMYLCTAEYFFNKSMIQALFTLTKYKWFKLNLHLKR